MPIRVVCPGCRATLSLADDLAGKAIRCKQCQTVCRVPNSAQTKAPAPAAAPTTSVPAPAPIKTETSTAAPASGKARPAKQDHPLPDKQKPVGSSKLGWIVGAGGIVFGLTVLGIVGALFATGIVQFASKTLQPLNDAVAAVTKPAPAEKSEGVENAPPKDSRKSTPAPQPETHPQVDPPKSEELTPLVASSPRKEEPAQPLGARVPPADKTPPQTPPAKTSPAPSETPQPPSGPKKLVKKLPGTIATLAVGGGGRYLILHLAREHKLAIFDVKETRIARYITLTDDNVKFTAGQDKIVLVLPDTNVIQRWDIASGQRDLAVPLAVKGTIKSVCMGSASQGPIFVGTDDGHGAKVHFFNLRSLKPESVKMPDRGLGISDFAFVRASADGKTFATWKPGSSPQGVTVLVVAGTEVRASYQHDSAGHLAPGPDGKVIYTGRGLWTAEAKRKDPKDNSYCIPAHQGDLYLSLELPSPFARDKQTTRLSVYMPGDPPRPLVTMTDIEVPTGITPWDRETFGFDQRFHFLPSDGWLITIPTSGDQVVLHRFDLADALEKSGADYLLVTSLPITRASSGAAYTYQIAAKSKQGSLKYRLDSGPKGMEVSASGLVKWTVPADLGDQEADVIVNVSDASGQEVFHAYKVSVSKSAAPVAKNDAAPPPSEEPKPAPPPVKPSTDSETAAKPKASDDPPSASGIKPPALSQDKVVKAVPSAITSLAVGGGGRYLILYMAKEHKLGIFDVNEARITRYITLTADNILFAASQSKIVVVLTDTNVIQRWDIAKGERDLSTPLATKGKIKFLSMGSASDGPILVGVEDGFRSSVLFADLKTLRPLPYRMTGQASIAPKDCYVRASADGKVFGLWNPGSSPQGIGTLVIAGKEVRGSYAHDSAGHVAPDADGKVICTASGLWTPEAKPLSKTKDRTYYLPAVQAGYYLSVRLADPIRRTSDKSTLSLFLSGTDQPIATLPQIDLPAGINQWGREPFGLDQHILFIPDAKLFVIVPETHDKLVLYRFNIVDALEQSGVDYLIVTSQPPRTVKANAEFTYQVQAKSKKGGVKYRLDASPEGMTISPEGQIKWKVPSRPKKDNEVIVNISDASGQERFHSFTIHVGNK